ncbi:MAG TPA: tRNA (guanosine(37)-N1)-methyltransferase TrmD [Pirellulales bacterium]|jgi:tRNA (guanine37-N1)-methyltransferase|nr:tRNA (guanosine(37)-N1)-methyltransferase TrmD [Pirellulales bacterium]
MRFDVATLFPSLFDSYVGQSLLKKAIDAKLVEVVTHDIRNWSRDKHHKVDDRPFGGGPGMVLRVEPVVECVEAVQQLPWKQGPSLFQSPAEAGHLIVLSPRGRRLNQQIVEQLAAKSRLVLLCGRYEGFDERVYDILQPDEISLGDFVLNGGEVAAMAVIDAVIRLVPGVLGDEESSQSDSFSDAGESGGERRLLEFAQYTRPREYRGREVPEILLTGNHEQIRRWRAEQSYLTTRRRRGDLLEPTKPPSE